MESHRRSLAKALSWRVGGLVVTSGVAWALTGKIQFALTMGLVDSLVKVCAYYVHERVWNRLGFGRPVPADSELVRKGTVHVGDYR